MEVINKNAVFREVLAKPKKADKHTYLKISHAIDGVAQKDDLSEDQKKDIIEIIRKFSEQAIKNVQKS